MSVGYMWDISEVLHWQKNSLVRQQNLANRKAEKHKNYWSWKPAHKLLFFSLFSFLLSDSLILPLSLFLALWLTHSFSCSAAGKTQPIEKLKSIKTIGQENPRISSCSSSLSSLSCSLTHSFFLPLSFLLSESLILSLSLFLALRRAPSVSTGNATEPQHYTSYVLPENHLQS